MVGYILVRGTKTGLPYSKGLLASSLLATGISPATAWTIADVLERSLMESGRSEVTVEELRTAVVDLLREEIGEDASQRYLNWQRAQERDRPLILLIGGATGVGKSTVATQVAAKLGITRIVSTDAIREVMRATIGRELLPHLHVSSFEAIEAVDSPLPGLVDDPVVDGFLRQTETVTVGVEQIVNRAVNERVDAVIEGVHIVPGLVHLPETVDAIVVQLLLSIEEVNQHRHNFGVRGQYQRRPRQRYLDHFAEIRRIQDSLIERAIKHDVPVVRSFALDVTVDEVTSLVVAAVTEMGATRDTEAEAS